MKRILLVVAMISALTCGVSAQSKRITEFIADTAPTSDDIVPTVNDPSGTPANRKVTLANLTKGLSTVVGDSGSGGTKGLVPAPAAGDAAAGKFLKADGTFAVPAGTGITASSTDTLTHKTIDAEGTGNTLTQAFATWFAAAGCVNTSAASFWDLPTSTPAVAACVTGSNTQKGVLTFADTSGGFSAQTSFLLPSDWSGNVDARIIWSTSATSGNAKFSLSTICTAVGATETDDPSFNTASTVTTAAAGTANRLQTSSISSLTVTGCAAGEFMHLKLFRDGNDGSDTLSASLNVVGVEITIRRAQ